MWPIPYSHKTHKKIQKNKNNSSSNNNNINNNKLIGFSSCKVTKQIYKLCLTKGDSQLHHKNFIKISELSPAQRKLYSNGGNHGRMNGNETIIIPFYHEEESERQTRLCKNQKTEKKITHKEMESIDHIDINFNKEDEFENENEFDQNAIISLKDLLLFLKSNFICKNVIVPSMKSKINNLALRVSLLVFIIIVIINLLLKVLKVICIRITIQKIIIIMCQHQCSL